MNKFKKMSFSFVLVILFLGVQCTPKKESSSDINKAIRLEISFPSVTETGNFIIIHDSLDIIYYKNYIIYKIPIQNIKTREFINGNEQLPEQRIVNSRIGYQFFIYKKYDSVGYFFDSLNSEIGMKIQVAEFIRKKMIINKNLLFTSRDLLIESSKVANGILCEKYIKTKKIDKWDSDTSILYFSIPLKNIDFTFHRELDSAKKMKLCKAKLIYNPDPKSTEFYFQHRREVIFSIKETAIENLSSISLLIKKMGI